MFLTFNGFFTCPKNQKYIIEHSLDGNEIAITDLNGKIIKKFKEENYGLTKVNIAISPCCVFIAYNTHSGIKIYNTETKKFHGSIPTKTSILSDSVNFINDREIIYIESNEDGFNFSSNMFDEHIIIYNIYNNTSVKIRSPGYQTYITASSDNKYYAIIYEKTLNSCGKKEVELFRRENNNFILNLALKTNARDIPRKSTFLYNNEYIMIHGTETLSIHEVITGRQIALQNFNMSHYASIIHPYPAIEYSNNDHLLIFPDTPHNNPYNNNIVVYDYLRDIKKEFGDKLPPDTECLISKNLIAEKEKYKVCSLKDDHVISYDSYLLNKSKNICEYCKSKLQEKIFFNIEEKFGTISGLTLTPDLKTLFVSTYDPCHHIKQNVCNIAMPDISTIKVNLDFNASPPPRELEI